MRVQLGALAALAVLVVSAMAAHPPDKQKYDQVTAQLSSGETAQIDAAVASIRAMFQAGGQDANEAASHMTWLWGPPLLQFHRYAEAADFSQQAICQIPQGAVYRLQQHRANGLRLCGRGEESLAAAKSLYNVASLQETASAIQVVCDCLMAARPDDPVIVRRFRRQQAEAASTQPATPSTEVPVLAGIAVDGKVYEPVLRQWAQVPGTYGLRGSGNLLLLADRPAEALRMYVRMYMLAEDAKVLNVAVDGTARSLKALDGNVGRANAFARTVRDRGAEAAMAEVGEILKQLPPATQPK